MLVQRFRLESEAIVSQPVNRDRRCLHKETPPFVGLLVPLHLVAMRTTVVVTVFSAGVPALGVTETSRSTSLGGRSFQISDLSGGGSYECPPSRMCQIGRFSCLSSRSKLTCKEQHKKEQPLQEQHS